MTETLYVPKAQYDAKVQQLEAERDEFNAGWKSCIEDLRKSAEICRQAETRIQQLEQRIGRLREALEARRVADRMWLDDSPHNLCHSQTKHAKELADAALKESE